MNPFVLGTNTATNTTQDLPLLQEYGWDFIHDTFTYDTAGKHKIVTENEALKVWIYKALRTERYRYEAYKHGVYNDNAEYGVELERFIGKQTNNKQSATVIKRYIEDGLIVNPYITKINSVDITECSNYKLILTVNLTSVYGNLSQGYTI